MVSGPFPFFHPHPIRLMVFFVSTNPNELLLSTTTLLLVAQYLLLSYELSVKAILSLSQV
jgi:hypothetical protein